LSCSPEEQRRLLGNAPFFAQLSADQVEEVAASFRQAHYAVDRPIHFAGEEATRLSIVAAGRVKLVRPTLDGQDVLLDILGPGDYFGSLADLGDRAYREDATAHTECCVLYTTAGEFQRLLGRYPVVALATLGIVSGRLRDAHETIEQISTYPVERRVAATLVKLAGQVGRADDESVLIEMPLSRQDLAGMTGAQVETVSRVISDFRRRGLVESGRNWIAVRDMDGLAAVAE
jgi:CRP-like cAMP-binding protein